MRIPLIATGVPFRAPTEFVATFEPGLYDGEMDIWLLSPPASWGDLSVIGDDAADAGAVEWWNPLTRWTSVPAPDEYPALVVVQIPPPLWGVTFLPAVRGVSDAGRRGKAVRGEIATPGSARALEALTIGGAAVTIAAEAVTLYV